MILIDMSFEFGNIDISIKMKNQDKIATSIHYGGENKKRDKHILFLIEAPLSREKSEALSTWIKKEFLNLFDYDIVCPSKLTDGVIEIKKQGIYKYYKENASEYKKYIRPGKTIVITFGIAISSVTRSNDLSYECFQDYVFNDTFFYSPYLDTYVFPIAPFDSLIYRVKESFIRPVDSSHVQFALRQFAIIRERYKEFLNPSGPERVTKIKIATKEDWNKFYMKFKSPQFSKMSIDLETTGLNFIKDKIICITVSFDGKVGFFIPWFVVDIEQLSDLVKEKILIGHNIKFDIKFLRKNGVRNLKAGICTHQLGHHLNEMRFNGLKSLAYHYTYFGGYDFDLDEYIEKYKPRDYSEIPEVLLMEYATLDAILTFQIYEKMWEQLLWIDMNFPPHQEDWWTLQECFEKIRMPALNNFIEMEMMGFYVNMKKWDEGSDAVEQDIKKLKDELKESFHLKDDEDNFSDLLEFSEEDDNEKELYLYKKKDTLQSGKKLGELLQRLGWENLGITKNGWYATGEEQLKRWTQLGHPEAKIIQNLRSCLTLQKTFLGTKYDSNSGWRRFVVYNEKENTYKIHCSYKSMLMASLRNGCGDPNYQQLPSSSLGAEYMKKVIVPPTSENHYLVTLDYSSFQLRLAAIDSNDQVLVEAYRQNPDADIHTKTAYNVFMKDVEFEISEVIFVDEEKKKTTSIFYHEEIEVMRGETKIRILAKDAEKNDILI